MSRFMLFLYSPCKPQRRKVERPKRSSLIIEQSRKYWKALCGCLMLFLMAPNVLISCLLSDIFASFMLVFLCVGAYVCALLPHETLEQNALVLGNRFFPLCASGLEVQQTSFCVIARSWKSFRFWQTIKQSHWVKNSLKRFTLFFKAKSCLLWFLYEMFCNSATWEIWLEIDCAQFTKRPKRWNPKVPNC